MKPCPKCGNQLAKHAQCCNGCGWEWVPGPPPMGFDALRAVARSGVWPARRSPYETRGPEAHAYDAERDAERDAIQREPKESAW